MRLGILLHGEAVRLQPQQQDGAVAIRHAVQRLVTARHRHAREPAQTFENHLGPGRVATQRGVCRIGIAARKPPVEKMQDAAGEDRAQKSHQQDGALLLHAAISAGAITALICWRRCRNASVSSAVTLCLPYQARSKLATFTANSARAFGYSRALRRSSSSYSRFVLPG